MKTRLLTIIIALVLLASLAVSVSADIGFGVWKMHCPDGASVLTYENAKQGGVDVVCYQFVEAAK